MATIAEQLLSGVQAGANEAPDLGKSFTQGAELGVHIQQVQQQRAELEQKKKEHESAKLEKVGAMLESASKMPDGAAKNAFTKEFIPKTISALGLEEYFHPVTQKMLTGDPRVAAVVRSGIRSGDLTVQDLQNPDKIADFANKMKIDAADVAATQENFTPSFEAAQKDKIEEDNKLRNAQAMAQAQMNKQVQGQGAAGGVKLSEVIATKFGDYSAAGGHANITGAITGLENALKSLKEGQVETGGITTKIPGFNSDAVQTMINPKMVEIKTQAQASLNAVLRQTLGAQFTEQEGLRVLNQVWDDKQTPAVNARKLERKIKELKTNVRDMEGEFRRFGYLKDTPKPSFKTLSPAAQSIVIKHYMENNKMSEAEARKALEGGQ